MKNLMLILVLVAFLGVSASPVKAFAVKHNISVVQTDKDKKDGKECKPGCKHDGKCAGKCNHDGKKCNHDGKCANKCNHGDKSDKKCCSHKMKDAQKDSKENPDKK